MLVRIKATGIKEAQAKLGTDLRRPITKRVQQAGTILLRAARREVPKKTRQLERSLAVVGRGMSLELVEGRPQGLWIREGTIGHSIFPKKLGGALWWKGLPRPVAWVAHPGIRHKNDYVGRAVGSVQGELDGMLRDLKAELVTELGG